MKNSQKKVFSFGDLKLRFKPKVLSLSQTPVRPLKVYLQKNVQVIGEILQLAAPPPGSLRYTYSQDVKAIEFRALSAKNCIYQVALYEVIEGTNIEQWLGQADIDLGKFLKLYEEEFRSSEQKLQLQLKEKESSLPQIWRALVLNFTQRNWQSGARFKSINALLQFQVEPWHDYDDIVRKDDLESARLQRQYKGKSMVRSSTQPNLLRNFNPGKPAKNSKEVKAELKRFGSEMQIRVKNHHLSNIEEQEESVAATNGVKTEGHATEADIDRELQDEELKQIKELPHQDRSEKHLLLPQGPAVGRYSSLVRPENSAPSRLGLVSMGSGTDKPSVYGEDRIVGEVTAEGSRWKEWGLTMLGFILAGVLLFFLMKPLPKVR